MGYDIKIDEGCRRTGMVEGTVSHYEFYAKVHHEPVPEGIDTHTMQKGEGQITQLCIYRDEADNTGDPFLPTMSIRRHIYINYEKEWKIYNFTFQNMVSELVHYLERRGLIDIVR